MKRRTRILDNILALDASIVAKWFKKGEEFEREALSLRDKILRSEGHAVTSEWLLLEVVRALVKVNYTRDKIEEAYSTLKEITSLGFIEAVPVREVLDESAEMEIALSLFASDAVYLATAVTKHATLITEDKHLLDRNVVDHAQRKGVRVISLKEKIW
jgi:predicted nucleic acid-binding protein